MKSAIKYFPVLSEVYFQLNLMLIPARDGKGGMKMSRHLLKKNEVKVYKKRHTGKDGQNIVTNEIPIAVSARHVHLSQEHVELLFGKGYELTKKSDLSQPGQFASNETVVITGPRGRIEHVRVLGPARSMTQAEVSWTDAMKLGIKPPLRGSGELSGSEAFTIIGPKASLNLEEGMIVAQAHIHMKPRDAKRLNVSENEYVMVEVNEMRPLVFKKVKVRISDDYRLEMHIDTDEANAGLIGKGTKGRIVCSEENRI